MIENGQLLNYIGGQWTHSHTSEFLDVHNPATTETIVLDGRPGLCIYLEM